MTSSLFRLLLIALFLVSGAPGAAADGLQRFERELLPKIQKGRLTYEKASALGADGFVLERVVVLSEPAAGRPSAPALRVARLEVEAIDHRGFQAGEARFAKFTAKGLVLLEAGEYGAEAKRYGFSGKPTDARLDYRYDTAAQVLTVNHLDVATAGYGRLILEAVFEKVPSLRDTRLLNATVTIRSLRLVYEDQSGLRQVLHGIGQRNGKSEDAISREWLTTLGVASSGKGQRTQPVADALASFLQDYRQPKGPITVTMRPPQPTSFGTMLGVLFLPDPAQLLGASASYPGTRPSAAASILAR